MPAQNKHKIKLNLLYPQGVPDKVYIRAWRWLLHSGSYIIICVELFVVAIFFLKIKMHTDLKALQVGVNQETDQIMSRSAQEAQIKQMQFSLETIKKNHTESPEWKELLTMVSAHIPQRSKLTLINLEDSSPTQLSFKINGKVPSSSELAALMSGLRSQSAIVELNLGSISYDQGVINFTMNGSMKKAAK